MKLPRLLQQFVIIFFSVCSYLLQAHFIITPWLFQRPTTPLRIADLPILYYFKSFILSGLIK